MGRDLYRTPPLEGSNYFRSCFAAAETQKNRPHSTHASERRSRLDSLWNRSLKDPKKVEIPRGDFDFSK